MAFENDLLRIKDIVPDNHDNGVFVEFTDYGDVKHIIICPKYSIRADREDYWDARGALRVSVVELAEKYDLHRTRDRIEDYGEHFYFVFVCGKSWNTRERLNAEWIQHMKSYRLYHPSKPQDTVAYVDDLDEVDKDKYDLVLCDADTMHVELIFD